MSENRRQIIAANWKMNLTVGQGKKLVNHILEEKDLPCDLVFAPPFTHLSEIKKSITDRDKVFLAAQNCHHESNGAYTGEISTVMLEDMGVQMVIVGHSERRQLFGDTGKWINQKIKACLSRNLQPIFCFGEKLDQREQNQHFETVRKQLNEGLSNLSEAQIQDVIFAYEPVWAIGTGHTATPGQAEEMHQFVRKEISSTSTDQVARSVPILYGGSVKPANASELLHCPNIDGALVGGASLKAKDFLAIVEAVV
ncbi:MAG: triose-phosphate isomerase [Saprospirales bacterium]|nr:MAG: triose-phosphate isomerase [Saprospirales bacterium]